MEPLIAIGVACGFAGGAFLGYVVTERLVERMATSGRAAIVRACAVGGALLALVPASFYAFVLGGNFGGASAAFLLGQWAAALGIGLGIALAFAICLGGAAVVGAILGIAISRALGRQRAA